MSVLQPFISVKGSLKAIGELYLIILGIGITESLVQIPEARCEFQFFGYILLLFGYLSTVFRFAIGGILMLEYLTQHIEAKLSRSEFVALVCLLLSALSFFLVGHHINHISDFLFYTTCLMFFDTIVILFRHQPWKQPHCLTEAPKKLIGVLSNFRFFKSYAPQHRYPDDPQRAWVKKTHYHWFNSNLGVISIMLLFLFLWHDIDIESLCPFRVPSNFSDLVSWLKDNGRQIWLYQSVLGSILLVTSIVDITANYGYYFGRTSLQQEAKAP